MKIKLKIIELYCSNENKDNNELYAFKGVFLRFNNLIQKNGAV